MIFYHFNPKIHTDIETNGISNLKNFYLFLPLYNKIKGQFNRPFKFHFMNFELHFLLVQFLAVNNFVQVCSSL